MFATDAADSQNTIIAIEFRVTVHGGIYSSVCVVYDSVVCFRRELCMYICLLRCGRSTTVRAFVANGSETRLQHIARPKSHTHNTARLLLVKSNHMFLSISLRLPGAHVCNFKNYYLVLTVQPNATNCQRCPLTIGFSARDLKLVLLN